MSNQHPKVEPNEADLNEADLNEADLNEADLNEADLNEAGRRNFFRSGLSAILTSMFGIGVINGLAQTKRKSPNGAKKDSYKSLIAPKKVDNSPDDKATNLKIRQLDEESRDTSSKITSTITSKQQTDLNEKIKKYKSLININDQTGIVKLTSDENTTSKDFSISKIESLIENKIEVIEKMAKDFLPNRVETLLNQAADLLDRGIRDRTEWDEKSIKFLDLALELNEFQQTDALLIEAQTAGLYKQDYNKAKNDFVVQEITQRKAAEAELKMSNLIKEKYSSASIEELQTNLRRVNQSVYFAGYHSDGGGPAIDHGAHFDNTIVPILESVNTGSLAINQFNLSIEEEINNIELQQLEANEKIATKNKKYYANKVEWESKNISFKEKYDEYVRNTTSFKFASFMDDNGVLNYIKRLIPLQQRFSSDFNEAYAKLKVAEYGVKAIYDYGDPLPIYDPNNVSFFDDCILWNRSAINFINRTTQNQITTTIPLSIRSMFDSIDQFNDSFQAGVWHFQIKKELFINKYQVKLLGVSLSIIGLSKHYKEPYNLDGCFKADISIPEISHYSQKSAKATTLDFKEYPAIPKLHIGNVYSNDSSRSPEIVGTDLISNLSPMGEWQISLIPTSITFWYEASDRGKIKRVSAFKKHSDRIDNASEEIIATTDSSNLKTKLENTNSRFPTFDPSDFWDLKLDLYVAYLT